MPPMLTWPRSYRHWTIPIVLVALLVGSLSPGLAKPVAADSYSISGTVTEAGTSTQLGGISIKAVVGNVVAVTDTAPNGTYSLTVLPGDYTVQFTDPTGAHVNGCYSGGTFSTDQNMCTPVQVAGSPVPGLDVAMPLGVVISGTVTEAGGTTRLAGIELEVLNDASTFDLGVNTDNNGFYALTVLPNDAYTVQFTDPTLAHPSGCYSNGAVDNFVPGCNGGTPVQVAGSPVPGLDVAMPIGAVIGGRVIEAGGTTPLANIEFDVWGPAGFTTGGQTDLGGSYSAAVPLNADYVVKFYDDSDAPHINGCYTDGAMGNLGTSLGTDQEACTPVSVTDSVVSLPDVAMPLGPLVRGTVTGPGGAPIDNIWVEIRGTGTFGTGNNLRSDGSYWIAVVSGGTYTVQFGDSTVAHPDGCYESGASGNFTTDGSACTPVPVSDSGLVLPPVVMPLVLNPLDHLALSPANTTITAGANQQFTATGTYADGSTKDVTASVIWGSATLAVATISASGLAAGVSVGTSTISATLDGVSGSATLMVTPAPLTVTADDQNMPLGGPVPALTWTGSGWVNGDGPGSLTTQPTCTTTATASSPVGTYPITCNGAIDPNYTISYVAATLTVAKIIPVLTYTGPTTAIPGATITLSATLQTPAGAGISSVVLIFSMNNVNYQATTNKNGVAQVRVAAPGVIASYQIVVGWSGNATYADALVAATLTVR